MVDNYAEKIQLEVFGPRYVGFDFESFVADEIMKGPVKEWLKAPYGFLVLAGSYGCGKTALGASLVPYIQKRSKGRSWRFIREDQFFDKVKNDFHLHGGMDASVKLRCDDHFFYYDDFGSIAPKLEEQEGNWRRDVMFTMFDFRYNLHGYEKGKSPYCTIISTNLTKELVGDIYGPRIYDRLVNPQNTWVDLHNLGSLRQEGL